MGFIQNLDVYREFQSALIDNRFVMDRSTALKFLRLASDVYEGTARMTTVDNSLSNIVQNVRLGKTINQLMSIAERVDSTSPYKSKLQHVIDQINHENDLQKIERLMSVFLKMYKQYQEESPVTQIQTLMDQIVSLDARTTATTETLPMTTRVTQEITKPSTYTMPIEPVQQQQNISSAIPPPPTLPPATGNMPPPPPPPPPPPMFQMFDTDNIAVKKPSVETAPVLSNNPMDMHSELMAAIRKGSPLKKVKKNSEIADVKKPVMTDNPLLHALTVRLDATKLSSASEESFNEDENGWLSDTQVKNVHNTYNSLMTKIKEENIQNDELTSLSMAVSRILKVPNISPQESTLVESYLNRMKNIIAKESTA